MVKQLKYICAVRVTVNNTHIQIMWNPQRKHRICLLKWRYRMRERNNGKNKQREKGRWRVEREERAGNDKSEP